jgi:hypothetical protein
MALITAGLESFEQMQPGRARTELLVIANCWTSVPATPTVSAAQRAATYARDRSYRFPGCNRWWGLHAPRRLTQATRTESGPSRALS